MSNEVSRRTRSLRLQRGALPFALAAGLGLAGLSLMTGCANPGPVKPPTLHLPALVTNLSAERAGNSVLLRWTTPDVTTDGGAIVGPVVAEICRQVGTGPQLAAAPVPSCHVVHRVTVSPGPALLADELTPALEADPVELVTYRIALYNSRERTAGYSSEAAYVASGLAPAKVTGLIATNTEAGTLLEWDRSLAAPSAELAELKRTDQTPASTGAPPTGPAAKGLPKAVNALPKEKSTKAPKKGLTSKARSSKPSSREVSQSEPNQVLLRVNVADHRGNAVLAMPARPGALDTAVELGHNYDYVVERVLPVTVAGHRLEIRSEPSASVTVARRDVFPPRRPAALEAVAGYEGASVIDLSWEPDTEPDLAGYLVERQTSSATGEWKQLTDAPIISPSFRDSAVTAGQRYRYRVIAVDTSGNRSAASDAVEETAVAAP